MGQGSFTPVTVDSCAVLGQFAALLAEGRSLADALRHLATGLALRTVVVRSASGDLLGVGGEALQSVQAVRSTRSVATEDVWLEFPVAGQEGSTLATMTVRGGRPSQLPALRAAAAILGLALASRGAHPPTAELLADSEQSLGEVADALHDGPMQSLMVARYAADAAVRGGDPVAARDAVQAAVVELRRLVWTVRPRGETGLVAALTQLSNTVTTGDAAPLEVSADGVDHAGAAAGLAFRIVQQVHALTVGRPVRVTVHADRDVVTLEVTGAILPTEQRWTQRATALGCRLSTSGEQTRLVMPAVASRTASTFSTDVRTSS